VILNYNAKVRAVKSKFDRPRHHMANARLIVQHNLSSIIITRATFGNEVAQ
jgi:hypothetical protein